MAASARRISKSSIDWAAFYAKMPAREQELYRALKNRSDFFVNKVHSNPESLGKIDFAHYKAALPGLKMVQEFEAGYAKVNVPYPVDKQNIKDQLTKDETEAMSQSKKMVQELEHEKKLSALYIEKLKELPKIEDITMEMLYDYFPWTQVKGAENPRFAPFNKKTQPQNLGDNHIN